MMRRAAYFTSLLSLLALAAQPASTESASRPDIVWNLTTLDGGTAKGALDLNAAGFVRAQRDGAKVTRGSAPVLYLRDGQQIPGQPATATGADAIAWQHPLLGKLSFPLKLVRGVAAAGHAPTATRGNEDVAILLNGDTIRGVVTESTDESLTIAPGTGDPVKVPWKSVGKLSLADLGNKAVAAHPTWQIELVDGTVLRAADLRQQEANLALGESKVPIANIATIERFGPAWSLVLLAPAVCEQHPYLTVEHPPRFGEARAPGIAAARAITISPYTRLSWKTPVGAAHFRTRCVVTQGQVKITASAGDQKAEKIMSAGASEFLELSVPPGADITIVVDFAASGFAGQAMLLDPLLSK